MPGRHLRCGTRPVEDQGAEGIVRGLLEKNQPVRVTTRGGDLQIRWAGDGAPVEMTGPAVTVFEGEIAL